MRCSRRPRRTASTLEVVIVDDNSPDGTGAVADELARTRPDACGASSRASSGSAPPSSPASAAPPLRSSGSWTRTSAIRRRSCRRMLAAFRGTGADVLVASRYIPGGSTPNWPFKRRLLSRTACLLARPLSPIRDAASGFFLIRRSIAERRRDQGRRLQDLPRADRPRLAHSARRDSVSFRRSRAGGEQDEPARGGWLSGAIKGLVPAAVQGRIEAGTDVCSGTFAVRSADLRGRASSVKRRADLRRRAAAPRR